MDNNLPAEVNANIDSESAALDESLEFRQTANRLMKRGAEIMQIQFQQQQQVSGDKKLFELVDVDKHSPTETGTYCCVNYNNKGRLEYSSEHFSVEHEQWLNTPHPPKYWLRPALVKSIPIH